MTRTIIHFFTLVLVSLTAGRAFWTWLGEPPPLATAQAQETMGHENHLTGAEEIYQQLVRQMDCLQPALAALVNADPGTKPVGIGTPG